MRRGEIEALDCARASTESRRLYLHATRASGPSTTVNPTHPSFEKKYSAASRGLSTAAYILLLVRQSSPPPLFAAGTAESAHLHMESGALNRNVIDLPPICKGEMFPNLPGLFLHHCMTRAPAGMGSKEETENPERRCLLVTPHARPPPPPTLVEYERQYIYNYACSVACIQECLK